MKNIFLIALSGMLMISSVSCDDFLTETPSVSIPDNQAFNTSQDYTNALNGLYQTLGRYSFLGRNILAMGDASSDLAAHTAATSHFYNIFRYQVLDTNTYLEEIWGTGYYAIDRASRIIAASETSVHFTESESVVVNRCVAQAYAVRALSSFYLVNYFGLPYSDANKSTLGIVNVTKPVAAFEQIKRSTVGENYDQILSDIAKAKEYFAKEGVEDVDYIFMNKAAVSALEARVKLYMKDYNGAIVAANQAIALKDGAIVSSKEDYIQLYRSLVISSEDIFVIAKSATDYLSANSLNTLYGNYGMSLNESTIAEYPSTDIRLALLGGEWKGGKMAGVFANNQVSNLPIFRLPEMYLTLAEAYAKTNKFAEAKQSLLEVAAKRNPALEDSDIPEDATIISFINKERKLELAQEGHRFLDARRLGEKISVGNGTYKNFDVSKFVYPIPAKEVNAGFGVVQTTAWDANLPK